MVACVIGALLAGPIADWTGRKKVLILCAVLFTVSAILSALPRSFTELVIARFIGGMGVGMASVVSPMYIAEISPAKIRGRLVALNQLAIVVGILLSYFSNWVLVDTGINNWRYMLVAEILPAITFLVGLFFIPESMSIGVVIWVYLSEIYPTRVRGQALSVATMVLWLGNVILTQLFPIMMERFSGGTFYIFSFICLLAFIFTWTMVKETRGVSLEEIEKIWV